jgi:hypothetical protein
MVKFTAIAWADVAFRVTQQMHLQQHARQQPAHKKSHGKLGNPLSMLPDTALQALQRRLQQLPQPEYSFGCCYNQHV